MACGGGARIFLRNHVRGELQYVPRLHRPLHVACMVLRGGWSSKYSMSTTTCNKQVKDALQYAMLFSCFASSTMFVYHNELSIVQCLFCQCFPCSNTKRAANVSCTAGQKLALHLCGWENSSPPLEDVKQHVSQISYHAPDWKIRSYHCTAAATLNAACPAARQPGPGV